LIALAHQEGVQVIPMVGPSALLLALMASGLNGQCFAFAGYLPQEASERDLRIAALEARSREQGETQLFIETPYRNQVLFEALLAKLASDTRLLVASALTLAAERIMMRPVGEWRKLDEPLPKVPTVFGLLASAADARRKASAKPYRRDRR
jgi:16S rRNA (cytidine1402-2'-O)-methyltransferase